MHPKVGEPGPKVELYAFSVKDQIINTLGFVGYSVSVVAANLCHCSAKAAPDKM